MRLPEKPIDVGSLIRRRGLPEPARSAEQVSEVRSDTFMCMVPMPASHTAFAIQAVLIQWRFRLSYTNAVRLHAFLAENEQFIAESCTRVLTGVHYRGTYMGLSGQRAAYTTVWGYDTLEAQGQWSRILDDRSSRFYQVVRDLRGYWTSDKHSTQENFGVAAGIDLTKEAFLAITVDAEAAWDGDPD